MKTLAMLLCYSISPATSINRYGGLLVTRSGDVCGVG